MNADESELCFVLSAFIGVHRRLFYDSAIRVPPMLHTRDLDCVFVLEIEKHPIVPAAQPVSDQRRFQPLHVPGTARQLPIQAAEDLHRRLPLDRTHAPAISVWDHDSMDEGEMIRRWVERWKQAGPELEAIRREEIAKADNAADLAALASAFNDALRTSPPAP